MSHSASFAPRSAKAFASTRPKPCAAPVINTTLSLKSNIAPHPKSLITTSGSFGSFTQICTCTSTSGIRQSGAAI
jgi:hypothetical protein